MDITLVLAVYNKLELTKECYKRIREIYPTAPFAISSGGSNDGTHEWLMSLNDPNLSYVHADEKLVFSENYNRAINLVKTSKLVLIHNDMVIGKYFLEKLDELLTPDTLLSYTTIEPPIFMGHERPGKVILDMGTNFSNFKWKSFDQYVERNKDNCVITDGAVFFMSGYKTMFEDIGFFDAHTFVPAFAEDDDFLIRAKLKGYNLKTTSCAITYHFVSQTSRFSNEFKNNRYEYEVNSNQNFIRKWGIPIKTFNYLKYWDQAEFKYKRYRMGIVLNDNNFINSIEPFFDKIKTEVFPSEYINQYKHTTNYNLSDKFNGFTDLDVIIYQTGVISQQDYYNLEMMQLIVAEYPPGEYELGNFKIEIIDPS